MKKNNPYFNNFLLSTVLFGAPMSIVYLVISGFNILIAVVLGIASGLLFGLLLTAFSIFQSKKFIPIREEIALKENIILDGGANHFLNKEAVGGWLFITENKLYFYSHKFNIQNHILEFPIADIQKATKLGKINTFEITLLSGGKEKFVVNNRNKWIQQINNLT